MTAKHDALRTSLTEYLSQPDLDGEVLSLAQFAARMNTATSDRGPGLARTLRLFLDGCTKLEDGVAADLSFMLSEKEAPLQAYQGPSFDAAERARILQALLDYSVQHGISSTILARRINGGKDPPWFRSFRRFFERTLNPATGKLYRTSDEIIAACAKFVDDITPREPTKNFASALSAFFGPHDLDWLPGDYHSISGPDFDSRRTGKTIIRETAGACTIEESRGSDIYDGAIAKTETGFIASLMNRAYKTPRTFVVQHDPDNGTFGRMEGFGSGVEFLDGATIGSVMRGGQVKLFHIVISERVAL